MLGPVLLWLLARSLFDDHFRPSWRHLLAVVTVLLLTLVGYEIYANASAPQGLKLAAISLTQLLTLTLVLLALLVTLRDWRADLVESRRRVRVVLVVVSGTHSVVIVLVTLLLAGPPGLVDTTPLDTINAGLIFLLSLVFKNYNRIWCMSG